jgi:hypothetical protein
MKFRLPAAARPLRAFILFTTVTAIFGAYFTVVRPWILNWGATPDEVRRPLPGDGLVLGATGQETRAITIQAPPETVFAWVSQLGQDRSGFYSFELLENLVGCEMPVEGAGPPAPAPWTVGDRLWMYPPHKAGGIGFATLREYTPGRVLAFGTRVTGTPLDAPEDGSWTFVIEPIGDRWTRLIVRGRAGGEHTAAALAFQRLVFEPIHFLMERRMLIGIRDLAERGTRFRAVNNVTIALWVVVGLMGLAAARRVVKREHWAGSLIAVFVIAGVFQFLTLAQPPLVTSLALVALTTMLFGALSGLPRLRFTL